MLRSLRTPLVGVGLVLALSACGPDPQAAPAQPPSTSTPSPSMPVVSAVPTPTSVATVQAEEPRFTPTGTFNEDDAIAFGVYFLQMINYARTTGDPSLLDKYSLPGCNTCLVIGRGTDNFREKGLRYLQPELDFEAAYLDYFSDVESRAEVRVQVSGDLGQMINSDGDVLYEPDPRVHTEILVQMIFSTEGWKLFEIL